jgi:hypothetical protein
MPLRRARLLLAWPRWFGGRAVPVDVEAADEAKRRGLIAD